MKSLESKLPQYGASIFSVMSGLAAAHKAINLSQGFPEFNPPVALQEEVFQAISAGRNQYAPMPGLMELRDLLAQRMKDWRGVEVNPETEITLVPGATAGLYATFSALVHPGDEVIVLDPSYDSYAPVIELNGGVVRRVNISMDLENVDRSASPWPWNEVKAVINSKTKWIVINTPHNPLGFTMKQSDWDDLASILKDSNVGVISDEVYEHMVMDQQSHVSVLQHAQLAQKAVAISSFGKTFHATGWKLGYVTAPAYISQEIRKVYQFMAFAANTPMQVAAHEFLKKNPNYEASVSQLMQQKRDCFLSLIAPAGLKLLPCEGSYFVVAEVSDYTQLSDLDYAKWLTIEKGLATIPMSAFSKATLPGKFLRFCFAKEDQTLEKAAQIICSLK